MLGAFPMVLSERKAIISLDADRHKGSRQVAKKFHLGWFMTATVDDWSQTFSADGNPWDGEFFVDMAKAMERACFDYIMLEDTLMIADAYGDSTETYLKYALMGPKMDPAPQAALIGAATKNMGVVATFSTMAYPPFMLARLCTTLDHICTGRFGWNIVTSGENHAARNFGMDELPPRQQRYDMADEYMQVVNALWGSWDPDAVVLDRATGTYADYTKVRPINFAGKYYKVRGPLNTAPSPQGRPTFVQAGGSPRGRQFAAETADSIIAAASGIEAMREYRTDIRKRAAAAGRNPDDIKVLFIVAPVLAETKAAAQERFDLYFDSPEYIVKAAAPDHQWRAGLARRLRAMGQRQDAAPAGQGSRQARPRRHGRNARGGRGAADRGQRGIPGRRLPDQFAVPEGQPALHQRDLRRPGAGAAAPRCHPHRVHQEHAARDAARVLIVSTDIRNRASFKTR
jgi:FMN-dependent oxidoreductase (nitrilotriacetate monooxygenase family)